VNSSEYVGAFNTDHFGIERSAASFGSLEDEGGDEFGFVLVVGAVGVASEDSYRLVLVEFGHKEAGPAGVERSGRGMALDDVADFVADDVSLV
jgi:hypothetical protein